MKEAGSRCLEVGSKKPGSSNQRLKTGLGSTMVGWKFRVGGRKQEVSLET